MEWSGYAYLVAAVCFIMALRGLSHPESARNGNRFGIVGMTIAIVTTLAMPNVLSYELIILGILIGGAVGTVIALKIEMTALPQLVAAFHSLVGLAAVFVAGAAFYAPDVVDHSEIAARIAARDGEGARQAIVSHIVALRGVLIAALTEGLGGKQARFTRV